MKGNRTKRKYWSKKEYWRICWILRSSIAMVKTRI